MLKDKLLLVDRAHWRGMKQLKKSDYRSAGHLGCSSGFNYNIYKPQMFPKPNSESREQIHSLLEKCSTSLRLISYRNFMLFLRLFFAIKNLEKRNFE